jgi:hypothetical protein
MSYSTEKSTKEYSLTQIEQNILIGSLLGDGSLALYGRSKNAYYREQGCYAQAEYRKWKNSMLSKLDFKYTEYKDYVKLYSFSNELFTDLYSLFYIDGKKTITNSNIKLLDHPIGLSTLYMDDGTLVIDSTKRKNKSIHIFPRIAIYTLSFSKEENELIQKHIMNIFNINFKLKKRTDGLNYILELNKKDEIISFIDLVTPYIKDIPIMDYKINIYKRLDKKKKTLISCDEYNNITCLNYKEENNTYTYEQEKMIINLLQQKVSQKEIALILNHSYWGVVDKIRRMRKALV